MSNNVTVTKGRLTDNIIPKDAIVVIELGKHKDRASPQQELLDREYDPYRQCMLARSNSYDLILRNSRVDDRIYAFVKIDNENETYEIIKRLADKLTEHEGKTIYMQRLTFDSYDFGKAALESKGMNVVYFTGEENECAEAKHCLFKLSFTARDLYEYCKRRIKGQDKELAKAVYYVYDYIESAAFGTKMSVMNWMLTAPSGMGKTEFFRCIEDFFADHDIPVPVIRFDLNDYSPTSFKGKEIDDIPGEIKAHQYKTYIDPSFAICFFDESDKKMLPNYTSKGEDLNAMLQSEILTLVEGIKANGIDSSKTMFVFLGAFQYLRDARQKKVKVLRSGFRTDNDPNDASETFYDDLTLDDMIEHGMLEELAGRITSVINFHKIDERQMKSIICDKAKQIGDEIGYAIRITDKGLKELMEIAYTNLGVRKPMNVIRELALSVIAHQTIFGDTDNDISEIVISGLEKVKLKTAYHSEKEQQKISQERTCESA